MWFRDDDGAFVDFAVTHPLTDAFRPTVGAVQHFFRPISVAVFWLAYHAFGLTYWPYQFTQVVFTFGIWAAFYLMLRQLWARTAAAIAATVLHPLMFTSLYYFTFRFSQVNYQLELLLGFAAVALGACGWRRRSAALLAGALLLTELAYGAKEPACVYLPILHAWAAIVLGRRAGAAKRWIALWLLALLALTAWHVWLVRTHLPLLAIGGKFSIDAAFVLERLRYYSGVMNQGLTGALLAVVAALACAVQAARIRRLGRWRWVAMGLVALAAGAASRFVHPVIPVLGASAAVLPAMPFALGALALVAATAQLQPVWTMYIMQATWLMTAALAAAIFHSPLPQALRRLAAFCRARAGLDLRLVAATLAGAALVGVLAKAPQYIEALKVTSQRRCIARDLTEYLARELPRQSVVALPLWEDIGTTHDQQHAMRYLDRAGVLIQWDHVLYRQLLSAYDRSDVIVVRYSDLNSPGCYLLATSRREMQAAERLCAELSKASSLQPVLLKSARHGGQHGGLWHVPAAPPAKAK